MADVYLAVAAGPGGFNKLVVIKQLRAIDDPTMLTMFLDEAKLAARVNHPNIVQTFEVAQEADRAYMAMEYLDGPSLSRLRRAALKKGSRVPLEIELHIMREVLLGLHSAHELKGFDGKALNVVHRDFTPQNIMTSFGGDAKIVDFGIAKALDQEGKTSAGVFKGKLSYAPPEQMMGDVVDRRTDLFAAGVMLFEAVTGHSPWKDMTNAQIVHALSLGKLPRLLEDESAPPELAAIIDQAMAIDPDDRYATADEMRLALDEFARDHQLTCDRAKLAAYIVSVTGDLQERSRKLIEERLSVATSLPTAATLIQPLPNVEVLTPNPANRQLGRALPLLAASDELPDTGKRSLTAGSEAPVSVVTTMSPIAKVAFTGLAAVVLVLVGVVGMLVLRAPTAPQVVPQPVGPVVVAPAVAPREPVTPPEPAAPVAPASPEPVARQVSLRLSATPASARLYLDGLELPSNPYEGTFPPDEALHELRAVAPGHVEVKRGLQYDRDLAVDLTLAKVASAAGRPVATKPAPPTTASPPAPAPKPDNDPEYFAPATEKKKAPKRTLDNVEFE